VELEEGIDGFLHSDDLSWTRKIKNPGSVLKIGEEIDAVVISVDEENHRIRLGVKQLEEDPWKSLKKTYPKGSVIEGEITSITDFGVFVRVPGGIEGLINKFNLTQPGEEVTDDVLNRFQSGEKISCLVTDVNPQGQRLSLSIREYERNLQKKELSKYIHDDDDDSTATFADILKEKGDSFDS
jgi:small subunit ribosomal protein S1